MCSVKRRRPFLFRSNSNLQISDWFLQLITIKILTPEKVVPPLVLSAASHLEFLQHDGLVCKAQVAAAEAQLLSEIIEVHLRKDRRGLWVEAMGCSRRAGPRTRAHLAVVANRHQPQALLLLVLQEEVLGDDTAHVLQVGHHLLHREHLGGGLHCHRSLHFTYDHFILQPKGITGQTGGPEKPISPGCRVTGAVTGLVKHILQRLLLVTAG